MIKSEMTFRMKCKNKMDIKKKIVQYNFFLIAWRIHRQSLALRVRTLLWDSPTWSGAAIEGPLNDNIILIKNFISWHVLPSQTKAYDS